MTLSIPQELAKKIKQFKEVRWSEVARQANKKRIEDLQTMEKIVQKTKLTQEDTDEIANLVKNSLSKRLSIQ